MGAASSVVGISASTLLEEDRAQNIHGILKITFYLPGAGFCPVAPGTSDFIMSSGRTGSESLADTGTAAGGGFGRVSGSFGPFVDGDTGGGGNATLGGVGAGDSGTGSGSFFRNSMRL